MLTRTLFRAALASAVLAAGLFLAVGSAQADSVMTVCPTGGGPCITKVVKGGAGPVGPPTGGAAGATCTYEGQPVACYDPALGWYWQSMGCYYNVITDPPSGPSPGIVWAGYTPQQGTFYTSTCLNGAQAARIVWYPNAAPGGGITPGALAAEAASIIPVRGPDIGIAPDPGGAGLVGLPVWLWNVPSAQTWGPLAVYAQVPGLRVDATATADHIIWDMGDGNWVRCDNPGTPYQAAYGGSKAPCGYTYSAPSRTQPNGRYTITATTTWNVHWTGGGQTGDISTTRTSQTTVRIEELQVVVR